MRAFIVTALVLLLGLLGALWVTFYRLFGPGGALSAAPAHVGVLWLLCLLVFTAVIGLAFLPDRPRRNVRGLR